VRFIWPNESAYSKERDEQQMRVLHQSSLFTLRVTLILSDLALKPSAAIKVS
jgi:hypothetical protein